MSFIINESTSILQLNTAGLQNGSNLIVFVSSTAIPGQLVTVIDVNGFISTPQQIRLSTTRSATLDANGFIAQRYGYISIVSEDSNRWRTVNCNSFPTTDPIYYRALDANIIRTSTLHSYSYVSTLNARLRGVDIALGSENTGHTFVSSLNVNSYRAYTSTSVTDPRLRIWGATKVYGSTNTVGAFNIRGELSTSGEAFAAGNVSSKLGIIYVGGDLTTRGSIRGQRGNQITVQAASTTGSASFNRSTFITEDVTVGLSLTTRNASTVVTTGNYLNATSSILWGSAGQAIQYRRGFLNFVSTSATIPAITTGSLTSSNAITTTDLTFQSFGPASTMRRFDMSGATITNANGSLQLSSIVGSYLSLAGIFSKAIQTSDQMTMTSLKMNDESYTDSTILTYPPHTSTILGSVEIPLYWSISSIGHNGTLNAANREINANILSGHRITARNLNTETVDIDNFNASSMQVTNFVFLSSARTFSLRNVELFNMGGSIRGSLTEIAQDVVISTIKTDVISSPSTIHFYGNSDFSLSTAAISSVTSLTIATSSLSFTNGILGNPVDYSTLNATAPWLLASTFNMNSPPFTTTGGLGTYFSETTFSAAKNQTAYYSAIIPLAEPMLLPTPYINTVAGRGTIGSTGDGGPASNATIGTIIGQPAIDSQGNVYFGEDTDGWRLRKIDATNTITTVGGANQFFYGDGQFPIAAALGPKLRISLVTPGTFLVTDASNVRLRYIDNQPIIYTIAGTGVPGYSGDGGLAYNATFRNPNMTASDSLGNIFVADTSNNMIRQISNFSTITRYAGNLQAGASGDGSLATSALLAAPYGVAVDRTDMLYITDTSNCVVRTINPFVGNINLFAGNYTPGYAGDNAPATFASMTYPTGITTDLSNNVFICDTGNSRIRRVDNATNFMTTYAGNGVERYAGDGGPAALASLSSPTGVASDTAGNIYIADTNNNCIRSVNIRTRVIRTVAGRPPRGGYFGDNTFATTALLSTPSQLALDPVTQFLYFSDDGNRRIRFVALTTGIIYDYAGNGSPFSFGSNIPASNAIFGSITCVTRDLQDNLYVADGGGNIIRKIDTASGIITSAIGTGGGGFTADGPALLASISTPRTMVVDSNNDILFCDTNNHRVRKYISNTQRVVTIAGTGVGGFSGDDDFATNTQLNFPGSLALDNLGNIFIGDSSNYRVRRVDTEGIITTYAGTGVEGTIIPGSFVLNSPMSFATALTVDTGNIVYLTDLSTNGLWKIGPTGLFEAMNTISTPSYLQDNAPLLKAQFNRPMGAILDPIGNFVIADTGNFRLRRTYTFGIPQIPTYLNMYLTYTNYYVSSATASIRINGNTVASFNESSLTSTFVLTDQDIYNYPLQGSNPVLGDQTPYIQISQAGGGGYIKLQGNLWVNQVPNQVVPSNYLDNNAGIIMNSGTVRFPYANNGITLENKYNDTSTRNFTYMGSLNNASDPALKEHIHAADLHLCYDNLGSLPLRTYSYNTAYQSTFHTRDRTRIGFLTSEVSTMFPHSITTVPFEYAWAPSSVQTLDLTQIKYTHLGATQELIQQVSTLEAEVAELDSLRGILRHMATQRNVIH